MSSFEGQTILVVGGAGFVGSQLTQLLLADQPKQIIIVDNLLSSDISQVSHDARVQFIQDSIHSDEVLYTLPKSIDYVFHLATFHGNQSSIAAPLKDHEHNTLTSLKLFNFFSQEDRLKSLKKIVYAGAGCTIAEKTFDEVSATIETEEVSLYLDSPYQMSKIFGEFYGNYYQMRYGLPFVKARFQNVYGPGEILGAGQWRGTNHTVWRNVIPTFLFKALHHEALPVENGGIATRDFIFVEDIAEGLMACALKGETAGVYNLASGQETSIAELANLINELCDNPAEAHMVPARTWDRSGKRFGDTSKSLRDLGFKAHVNLPEGLKRTVEWTKANLEVIKVCMSKHQRYVSEVADYL